MGPKQAPKRPKRPSRDPPEAQTQPEDGPRGPQEDSQEAPRTPTTLFHCDLKGVRVLALSGQERPKTTQDGSQIAPWRPKSLGKDAAGRRKEEGGMRKGEGRRREEGGGRRDEGGREGGMGGVPEGGQAGPKKRSPAVKDIRGQLDSGEGP
eukprot:7690197-Pyramimonas_sp.AAC.1